MTFKKVITPKSGKRSPIPVKKKKIVAIYWWLGKCWSRMLILNDRLFGRRLPLQDGKAKYSFLIKVLIKIRQDS